MKNVEQHDLLDNLVESLGTPSQGRPTKGNASSCCLLVPGATCSFLSQNRYGILGLEPQEIAMKIFRLGLELKAPATLP